LTSANQRPREEFRYRAQHHRNSDGTIGEPRWLCGEAIDYRLKFPHSRSWSLDDVIPVSENPALMLNRRESRPLAARVRSQGGLSIGHSGFSVLSRDEHALTEF
jgi:hypothetical protein